MLWDPAEALGRSDPVTDPAALARLVEGPNVAAIAAPLMYRQGRRVQLLPRVEAGVDPSTGFLAITGIGSDAASAQTTANSFTQGLIVYLTQLKTARNNQERHVLQLRMETLAESGAKPAEIEALHKQLRALAVERTTPVSLREFERREPIPRPLAAGTADRGDRTRALGAGEHRLARAPRRPVRPAPRDPARARARAVRHSAPLDRTGRGGVRDARPRRGPHDPCRASGGRGDGDTSVFARGERVPPRPGRDGSMDRCGARRDHDPGHERRGS